MKNIGRLISGLVFLSTGIVLTSISFFSSFVFLIYSLPLIVLGVWILANQNEDKIEERLDEKDLNKKRVKR